MLRTASLLGFTLCACGALAQLPDLPKNVPGAVTMQRLNEAPTKTVKPVYPDVALQKWIQGTVTLDVVISADGKAEQIGCDSYCQIFPREMGEAAADAVKQWTWNPVLVKGKAARVKTRVAVQFALDEHSPPVAVCNIVRDPKTYVGKVMNVVGMVKREHGIKVLVSSECNGALEVDDDNALTPPQKDAKYAAMEQVVAAGSGEVTVRGLVRDENRPGAYPGYRVILERVLKVK
ncbi:TonB-like protein [Candidatus Koribacter versatilis Ellin345]|uniref:TonB-like protein n=1 Tax=Koribacter versatilis (strain Ellin345) TaxID=204669 RepID=Q1ISD0_KORVE|nr:energy transducer TonB [Candidatus Koribacter versatilis]ABF40220.1 TonB-like protein [Candidatus Koribacter versatilis Ellin345]